MKKFFKYSGITLLVLVLLAAWPAYQLYSAIQRSASDDPRVWEETIQALVQNTDGPPGAILFMGSSSIRLWNSLAQDMAPLVTVNRGFGGAKLADAIYYADQLVDIEDPGAIVIFVGTNDIHPGASKKPEVLLQAYRELVARIRQRHASTAIYYIAITPSPMRWEAWPTAQQTNRLIQEFCATEPNLHFIDTGAALIEDDVPQQEFYRIDGLHLSAAGYRIWTEIIRARLLEEIATD